MYTLCLLLAEVLASQRFDLDVLFVLLSICLTFSVLPANLLREIRFYFFVMMVPALSDLCRTLVSVC